MIEKIPSFFYSLEFLIIAAIFAFVVSVYFIYKIVNLFRLKKVRKKIYKDIGCFNLIFYQRHPEYVLCSSGKTLLLTNYALCEEYLKKKNEKTDVLLPLNGCKLHEDYIECSSVCKNIKDKDNPNEI